LFTAIIAPQRLGRGQIAFPPARRNGKFPDRINPYNRV
jgi:hypothetical protein